jgi:hypothetical protein
MEDGGVWLGWLGWLGRLAQARLGPLQNNVFLLSRQKAGPNAPSCTRTAKSTNPRENEKQLTSKWAASGQHADGRFAVCFLL